MLTADFTTPRSPHDLPTVEFAEFCIAETLSCLATAEAAADRLGPETAFDVGCALHGVRAALERALAALQSAIPTTGLIEAPAHPHCRHCHNCMIFTSTPGDEPCWECGGCGWTVHSKVATEAFAGCIYDCGARDDQADGQPVAVELGSVNRLDSQPFANISLVLS